MSAAAPPPSGDAPGTLQSAPRVHALTDALAHWPSAVATGSAEGEILAASPAALALLRTDTVTGVGLASLFGPGVAETLLSSPVDDLVVELDTEASEWERRILHVSSRRMPDGTWLYDLRDGAGDDRVRRHLEQAERLASVGELLSSVAHELNNPLTTVLGYAEFLLADDDPALPRDELDQIRGEALRCKRIVGNLLDLSRAERLELQPMALRQVVEKVVEIRSYAATLHEVQLTARIEPEAPFVLGDFHRLVQAVLNLVTNAEQSVRSRASDRRIEVALVPTETGCRLTVEDNGPGVPEPLREAIFQPFFTTKPRGEGTGLGLSLVRATAEAHAGTIRVIEGDEGGACFVLDLPAHVDLPTIDATAPDAG